MRRFINIVEGMRINEAWTSTVRAAGQDVDVFRNPSKMEVLKLIREFDNAPLRADIEWQTKDLLAWNSDLATHSDLMNHFGMTELYLYLHPRLVQMNDIQYHRDDDGQYGDRLVMRMTLVLESPHIQRIYGTNPTVKLLDNETGGMFDLTRDLIEKVRVERPVRLEDLT